MDRKLRKAAEDVAKGVEGIPGPFGDMMRSLMAATLANTDEEAREHAAEVAKEQERKS